MKTKFSSPGKPAQYVPGERRDRPIQTGALAGGQPGQGANTSSSVTGQSNADAAFGQGTEYGEDAAKTAPPGATVDDDSPAPDDQLVREAAYRRFEARGSVHGHDEEDWLSAERAVRPPPGN